MFNPLAHGIVAPHFFEAKYLKKTYIVFKNIFTSENICMRIIFLPSGGSSILAVYVSYYDFCENTKLGMICVILCRRRVSFLMLNKKHNSIGIQNAENFSRGKGRGII